MLAFAVSILFVPATHASFTCNTTYYTPYYGGNTTGRSTCYDNSAQYLAEARNNALKFELEANAILLRAEQKKQANDALSLRIDTLTQDVKILFARVFGRQPSIGESNYWVLRGYKENMSNLSLEDKMKYYLSLGKTTSNIIFINPSTANQSGSTNRIAAIFAESNMRNTTSVASSDFSEIENFAVPAVVEQEFRAVYGKKPLTDQSDYWKYRARLDKKTRASLRETMKYWLAQGFSPIILDGYIYTPLVK